MHFFFGGGGGWGLYLEEKQEKTFSCLVRTFTNKWVERKSQSTFRQDCPKATAGDYTRSLQLSYLSLQVSFSLIVQKKDIPLCTHNLSVDVTHAIKRGKTHKKHECKNDQI